MLQEGTYAGEFLLSEGPGTRSRDNIVIGASQTLKAGHVLGGPVGSGAQAVTTTPYANNVGNGAFAAAPTADAAVPPGRYKVELMGSGATAAFTVYRPDLSVDGHGAVGTAYNGSVNFTLNDGGADYVPGDGHFIDVSYAADRYVLHDPEGTDGRQYPAGLLYAPVTTGVGETAQAVRVCRDAEVIASRIQWDDHDAAEKAAFLADLDKRGVIAR